MALLTATLTVRADVPASPAPQAELLAPGIWHLHFGTPEPFTPLH